MRKTNKLLAAALVVVMSITAAVSTMAAVTRTTSNGLVYTDNGKNINYPCWIWRNGFCYYYQNGATVLKNTTTPDGYTVDAEGRWVVNGVPQSNGYGFQIMGTAEYNRKSNDEIWNLMLNKIEPVFLAGVPNGNMEGLTVQYLSGTSDKKAGIAFDIGTGAVMGRDITVLHNSEQYGTFVTARIGEEWADQEIEVISPYSKTSYAQKADIKEKTIKAVVGDQIGQELFHYIRAHADKMDMTGGYKTVVDANGNLIMGSLETILDANGWVVGTEFIEDPNGPDRKREWSAAPSADGINAPTLDLSMWQNRTTDYGKTFNVTNNEGLIVINVY